VVDLALLDRAVVHAHPRVVADRRRLVDERAERQVLLAGTEDRTVDEIHRRTGIRTGGADRCQLGEAPGRRVEAQMPQPDVGPHRLQVDLHPKRVAQRTVGVGEAREQVGVFVVRPGHDHPAVPGQYLQLMDRLVRHPVAERRRLDTQSGDRPTQGDGLQLRYHQRHQAVAESRVDEPLVGHHALHVGGTGLGVDREHLIEPARVQSEPAPGRAETEEVRRPLGQPHRCAGRYGAVCGPQRVDRPRVRDVPVTVRPHAASCPKRSR
jgi:hypothetical protein